MPSQRSISAQQTMLSGAEDFRLAEREVNQTQLKIEAERLTLAFNAPLEPLRYMGSIGDQPGLFAEGGDIWGW